MSKTDIPYLGEVLNATSGCTKISEGCANCYAERINLRFGHTPAYDVNCPIKTHPERLEEALRWRTPRRAGVCFTSDLFHGQVPDEFIDKVFAVMALTPQHTYLLLTKRPERMRAYLTWRDDAWPRFDGSTETRTRHDEVIEAVANMGLDLGDQQPDYLDDWPLPNVWLGVSCENQRTADERIPLLLDTPAAHRWVSLEPLLGPIDLEDATGTFLRGIGNRLGLCVIGGESGPHARPCDLGWIRDIRDQCKAAGVACYVEQMGSAWAKERPTGVSGPVDFKGEGMRLWPLDLRVREWPEGSER